MDSERPLGPGKPMGWTVGTGTSFSGGHCIVLFSVLFPCTSSQCMTLHYVAIHCVMLHCFVEYYFFVLRLKALFFYICIGRALSSPKTPHQVHCFVMLHCIGLHWITKHCIALR